MNHAPAVTWRTVGLSLGSPSSQHTRHYLPSFLTKSIYPPKLLCGSRGYSVQRSINLQGGGVRLSGQRGWWTQKELGTTLWIIRCAKSVAIRQSCWRRYSTNKGDFGSLTELEYRLHPNKLKRLPRSAIIHIYGDEVSTELGNQLLLMLQKQRVTGTLDYDIDVPGATNELIAKSLQWLRANHPLDEDAAIIKRIEREEKSQEAEYIARGEKLGLYKPQSSVKDGNVYGDSQFEKRRKENEAKWAAEQKIKAEKEQAEARAAEARGDKPGGMVKRPQSRAILAKQEATREWAKKYYEESRMSQYTDVSQLPKMTKMQRLLPSAIFVALTVAASIVFAAVYKPPSLKARLFDETPPAVATVTAIIALNILCWMAWRLPPYWRVMNKYFLMSVATPTAFSLLGNAFSHQSFKHLALNMTGLWFLGVRLHDDIGRGNFLALYISSSVLSSFASLTRSVLRGNLITASLGASGAVAGILGCYLLLRSHESLHFIFWPGENSPSVQGIWVFGFLLLLELIGLRRGKGNIDHTAHIGGLATGVATSEWLKSRARARRAERQKQAKVVLPG